MKIITEGQNFLNDGTEIKIVKEQKEVVKKSSSGNDTGDREK